MHMCVWGGRVLYLFFFFFFFFYIHTPPPVLLLLLFFLNVTYTTYSQRLNPTFSENMNRTAFQN